MIIIDALWLTLFILFFIGLLIFISAMITMKTSWRVGIDSNKTELVTHGIYKYSRNPAFVGFNFMFIGLFVTYPNYLTLIVLVLNIFSIHFLILQEEEHLKAMFTQEYNIYRSKTSRYLFL